MFGTPNANNDSSSSAPSKTQEEQKSFATRSLTATAGSASSHNAKKLTFKNVARTTSWNNLGASADPLCAFTGSDGTTSFSQHCSAANCDKTAVKTGTNTFSSVGCTRGCDDGYYNLKKPFTDDNAAVTNYYYCVPCTDSNALTCEDQVNSKTCNTDFPILYPFSGTKTCAPASCSFFGRFMQNAGFQDADNNCQNCRDVQYGCLACKSATACQTCRNNFKQSTDKNTCVACPFGSTVNSKNECIQCIPGCAQCEDTTSCVTPFDGYYYDSTNKKMAQCYRNSINVPACKTCTSSAYSDCSVAADGYYISAGGVNPCLSITLGTTCKTCDAGNDKCTVTMPGFYLDNAQAVQKCMKGCKKCADATSCLTPADGYYFSSTDSTMKLCYTPVFGTIACKKCLDNKSTSCLLPLDGFHVQTSDLKLTQCPESMKTCSGAGGGVCTACKSNAIFANNYCYTCSPGKTRNAQGQCDFCPTYCLVCNDKTSCDTPVDGFFFDSTSKYMKRCDTLYLGETSCKRCSGTGTGKCTQAMDGFYLDTGDATRCLEGCKTCKDDKTCSSCIAGYKEKLADFTCEPCDSGEWVNYLGSCVKCLDNCAQCEDTTTCVTPADGFWFDSTDATTPMKTCALENCKRCADGESTCLQAFDGFYVDSDQKVQPCKFPCVQCRGTNYGSICDKVDDGSVRVSGQSKNNGYDRCWPNDDSSYPGTSREFDFRVTCKTCYSEQSGDCIQAMDGTYLDSPYKGRTKFCLHGCAICEDGTTCVLPKPGYYYDVDTKSMLRCKGVIETNKVTCKYCKAGGGALDCITPMDGYFLAASNNAVKPCLDNCLKCVDDETCLAPAEGYFLDTSGTDPKMTKCNSITTGQITCKTCSDDQATSCSVPMPGYFLASTTVTKCDDTCKTCSAADKCDISLVTCSDGKQLNSKNECVKCLDNCAFCEDSTTCKIPADGYFFDSTYTQTMKQCGALTLGKVSCKRCGNSAATSCQEPMDGYYLDGYYVRPCMPSCKTCSDGISCTSSADGYFFDSSGSVGVMKACDSVKPGSITCKQCTSSDAKDCTVPMDGYTLVGTTVTPCDDGCQTCSTSASKCTSCLPTYKLDSDANTCTACATGEQANTANTCVTCLKNCLFCEDSTSCAIPYDGYYFDASAVAMKKCGSSCKKCSAPGNVCQEAMDGFYLDNTVAKKCKPNFIKCDYKDTCITPAVGYYYIRENFSVQKCYSPNLEIACKQCVNADTDKCLEAADGYYLEKPTPPLTNPISGKVTACITGCSVCSDGKTCEKCADVYKLKDDKTCEKCPAGPPQQVANSQNVCVGCLLHCKKCEDSTSCITADDGWFYDDSDKDNVKMSQCGQFYQGFYSCMKCDNGALDHCTKAFPGYYLEDGKTAKKCHISCLTCKDSTSCDTCPTGFDLEVDSRNQNLCAPKVCPWGRYPDAPTASCLPCGTNYPGKISCQQCTDSGVDKCTTAAAGYFLDTTTAKACHSSCSTCDSATNCLVCNSGLVKGEDTRNVGLCAPKCPIFNYPDADTQTCKLCAKVNGAFGCAVCTDAGATKCVAAMGGYYLDDTSSATICHVGCATCSDGTKCDTCVKGSSRDADLRQTERVVFGIGDYRQAFCAPVGCPESTYADATTNTCIPCAKLDGVVSCKKCYNDQADQCIVAMPGFYIPAPPPPTPVDPSAPVVIPTPTNNLPPYQPYVATATKCNVGCLTCVDGVSCIKCSPSTPLSKIGGDRRPGMTKLCAPVKCQFGYFPNGLINDCDHCTQPDTFGPMTASCKTCSDAGADKCTSTFDGYYLDGTTIKKCLAQCLSCSDGTSCKTCPPGFLLGADFRYPFLCAPGVCDAGKYPDTSIVATPKCSACALGCSTCRTPLACQTCKAGNTLGADVTQKTLCAPSTCAAGKYSDATTVSCKACLSNCVNCTSLSPTTCNKCAAAFYLSSDKSACNACSDGCATCSGATQCDTCTAGNQLGLDAKNPKLCAPTSCVAGQYPDAPSLSCKLCSVISNCARCTTPDVCSQCADGYQLGQAAKTCVACKNTQFFNTQNRQCVDLISCGPGWYNDGANKCLTCSNNCAQCEDKTGKCTRCILSYQVNSTTFLCQKVGSK